MFISDTSIFFIAFGVFVALAAVVSGLFRAALKKQLAYMTKYGNQPQGLHYTPPPPGPTDCQIPPPPDSVEYERQRSMKILEETLQRLQQTTPTAPTPGQEIPQETLKSGHDYTIKINGQQPAEPKSFFQSTAFKVIGAAAAVIIGLLAYIFIFLPK